MPTRSLSIELGEETLRGLEALGEPALGLAGLADSAAANVRRLNHLRREDVNLGDRTEEGMADDRGRSARKEAEAEAYAALQIARYRADKAVNARDACALHSQSAPGATAVHDGAGSEREPTQRVVAGGPVRTMASAEPGDDRPSGAFRKPPEASSMNEYGPPDSTIGELREANSHMVGATLRAHDLAVEAVEAKRRAEEVERELRAVAEFRETFIAILAHDLRNPLNTMVMATGLLTAHGRLGHDDARLVNRIANSGHRMARMITQVVDFARARLGGGFELARAPTDLQAVCRDIAEELRIGSAAEVCQTTEGDVSGTWDADRLAQALSNLVGNAVSHAAPGTPVTIHCFGDDATAVVEVTNHGVAIADEVLPRLFEAYRRGKGRAAPDSGSAHLGLGLYISSEIVRAHGGTLGARSSGGLTTFTMRLPRRYVPPAAGSTRWLDQA